MELKNGKIFVWISVILLLYFIDSAYIWQGDSSLKAQSGELRSCLMAARSTPSSGARSYACAQKGNAANLNWCSDFALKALNDPGVRYINSNRNCSDFGFNGQGTTTNMGIFWSCSLMPGSPMECPQNVKNAMLSEIGF